MPYLSHAWQAIGNPVLVSVLHTFLEQSRYSMTIICHCIYYAAHVSVCEADTVDIDPELDGRTKQYQSMMSLCELCWWCVAVVSGQLDRQAPQADATAKGHSATCSGTRTS